MGGATANDKGVLASTHGNSYRAPMPAAGAKGAGNDGFQKPAPRLQDAGAGVTKPGDAGKENNTTARSAAATASTSGESEQAEKRWQVRDNTNTFSSTPKSLSTHAQTPHAGRRAIPSPHFFLPSSKRIHGPFFLFFFSSLCGEATDPVSNHPLHQ